VHIEPLFSEEQIQTRVREIAEAIAGDYAEVALALVCIRLGAQRFTDDLAAALSRLGLQPLRVDVRASRTQGTTLGPVQVRDFEPERLAERHVLVVDDLAEEGATLRAVIELVALGEPLSVRCAVLIDKQSPRRQPLALDYVGFRVESGWVIGYGMDVDGEYRELDWIGRLVDDRF
jgi:hypoxanthine phosphoribosyltransferase